MGKFLSFKTLYIFFAAKLIAWGIGLLVGMQVLNEAVHSPIPDVQYLRVATGVLALANLRWNNYYVYTLVSLEMIVAWTYALFQFGIENVSFARTIPETILVYMLAVYIQINRKNPNGPLA